MDKSDDEPTFEKSSGLNIEVFRTAFNLHKQGLMMPWIFQSLYKVFLFSLHFSFFIIHLSKNSRMKLHFQ